MLGADGVLRPGGGLGAGSGQSYYLGYRGLIYLCGLTCFCRLGDPKSDSAQVHLFILQAGLPNRTRPGSEGENGGVGARAARHRRPLSKTRSSVASCSAVGGGKDTSS